MIAALAVAALLHALVIRYVPVGVGVVDSGRANVSVVLEAPTPQAKADASTASETAKTANETANAHSERATHRQSEPTLRQPEEPEADTRDSPSANHASQWDLRDTRDLVNQFLGDTSNTDSTLAPERAATWAFRPALRDALEKYELERAYAQSVRHNEIQRLGYGQDELGTSITKLGDRCYVVLGDPGWRNPLARGDAVGEIACPGLRRLRLFENVE